MTVTASGGVLNNGFTESGTFTLARPGGPVNSFSAHFSINPLDKSPTVTGTKQLVQLSGTCTPTAAAPPPLGAPIVSVSGTTSYSVTSPFMETGTAPITIRNVSPFEFSATFSEGPFVSQGPLHGSNSSAAHQCQHGGWQTLFRSDGTGFKNTGDCVSYAAQGGTFGP